MPKFSDDDYIDFCVTEALVVRGREEEQTAEKSSAAEKFRQSHKGFDPGNLIDNAPAGG